MLLTPTRAKTSTNVFMYSSRLSCWAHLTLCDLADRIDISPKNMYIIRAKHLLNITSHQGNANQKLGWDTTSYPLGCYCKKEKRLETTSVGNTIEKLELFCTVGKNVKCCSHCGNSKGYSFKTQRYHMTQQFYFWVLTQKSQKLRLKRCLTSVFVAAFSQ